MPERELTEPGDDPVVRLSIIVPAFNEARRLEDGMDRFEAAVSEGAVDPNETEIILVDDGSTDATPRVAARLLAPLPHHQIVKLPANAGKGGAVRAGVHSARGELIAYMDADMAIDPRDIPLLVEGLSHHDIVVGCRALNHSNADGGNALRSLMSLVFNRLVTAGSGLHLRDTQCGFKAFRGPIARSLFENLTVQGFAFDVEILLRAHQWGLSITEVPVQWKNVRGSTVHPLRDALKIVQDVVRLRWSFFGDGQPHPSEIESHRATGDTA